MTRQGLVSVIGGVVVSISLTAPSSGAILVKEMQYYLKDGADCFTTASGFFLDDTPTDFGGLLKVAGQEDWDYEIRSTDIALAAASLKDDQSGSGVAKGWFATGTTLTISGEIWERDGTEAMFTGDVLVATVSGDRSEQSGSPGDAFCVWEEGSMRTLTSRVDLDVTGGELQTGATTGLSVHSQLKWKLDLYFCSQGGMPVLNDFTGTINYIASPPSSLLISTVPEPTSLVLLGLGWVLLVRKNRRK